MPAYKAKYMQESIQSVLNQTYFDFELIIVNDKSPEDLDAIVNSFDDPRIRYYVNEENLGKKDIVANWNKCLSYANGEFFSLICDDDIYEPEYLETMMELAQDYPTCNVFRSGVKQINEKGEVYSFYPSSPQWESCEDYMWHVFRGYRCQTVSEWFYRTAFIKQLGGYFSLPLAWYSDFLSSFIFSQEGGIASTNKHLVTFRMSGENITSQWASHASEKMEASVIFEAKVKQLVDENHFEYSHLILPQLQNYMKRNRLFLLSTFHLKDLITCYRNRRRYNISNRMILGSFVSRLLR